MIPALCCFVGGGSPFIIIIIVMNKSFCIDRLAWIWIVGWLYIEVGRLGIGEGGDLHGWFAPLYWLALDDLIWLMTWNKENRSAGEWMVKAWLISFSGMDRNGLDWNWLVELIGWVGGQVFCCAMCIIECCGSSKRRRKEREEREEKDSKEMKREKKIKMAWLLGVLAELCFWNVW